MLYCNIVNNLLSKTNVSYSLSDSTPACQHFSVLSQHTHLIEYSTNPILLNGTNTTKDPVWYIAKVSLYKPYSGSPR